MKKLVLFLVGVVLVAGGGAYLKMNYAADPQLNFRTVTVKRGEVISTIAATGTVEPEEVVDVGAQVAGMLIKLGPDPRGMDGSTSPDREKFKDKTVDYCTPVSEGDLLAKIDKSVYEAQRDQAQATLERSKADLKQLDAKFAQTTQDWKRAQNLMPQKAISQTDFDMALANYNMAFANVDVGKASISQNEAMLKLAQRNLDYTTIISPVDGVIIARRVNVGQTVVASLNTPSLFLIAKDLHRMEVWASVNEADIGRIHDHPNMPVRFTVDAYPNEVFHGRVEQVRLNASSTQNVVLYTVVVAFDNPDLKILPYMTASLQFDVERHDGVLQVSNTALRWNPKLEQVLPEMREKVAASLSDKDADKDAQAEKKPSGGNDPAKFGKVHDNSGRLWVREGIFVRPVEVQKGLTDGTVTEISGSELKESMEAVIGEKGLDESNEGTNPFMPKIFNKKR